MIYQRRSSHHIADRSIALMPIAEESTLYDRHPWLFWACAAAAVLLAAWVTM